jgi:hypothetical protein
MNIIGRDHHNAGFFGEPSAVGAIGDTHCHGFANDGTGTPSGTAHT